MHRLVGHFVRGLDQGDYDAAREYYERALAILEIQLGPEHPSTKTVRGNLEALLDELEETS